MPVIPLVIDFAKATADRAHVNYTLAERIKDVVSVRLWAYRIVGADNTANVAEFPYYQLIMDTSEMEIAARVGSETVKAFPLPVKTHSNSGFCMEIIPEPAAFEFFRNPRGCVLTKVALKVEVPPVPLLLNNSSNPRSTIAVPAFTQCTLFLLVETAEHISAMVSQSSEARDRFKELTKPGGQGEDEAEARRRIRQARLYAQK
jgi:hypothetical protein